MDRSSQILENAAKTLADRQFEQRGILVVESDPDLQWRLARMLTVEGNRVVGTSSADGALALIDSWRAGLILVAERLDGMDGFELADRLRVCCPAVPVIMMTEQPARRSRVPNIAGFLVKPFPFDALRALIRSVQVGTTPAE